MADYVSPGTRRSAMGDTYLKQQALATPGSVAGDGGYVYRPDDAGSAITVLYDPTQAATGVTLTEGPEFEAIRSELVRRGVMSPAEPPVGVSAGEAEMARFSTASPSTVSAAASTLPRRVPSPGARYETKYLFSSATNVTDASPPVPL